MIMKVFLSSLIALIAEENTLNRNAWFRVEEEVLENLSYMNFHIRLTSTQLIDDDIIMQRIGVNELVLEPTTSPLQSS